MAHRYPASASSFDQSSGTAFPNLQVPNKPSGLAMKPVRDATQLMKLIVRWRSQR
jgi:hypothetical protein